MKKYQNIFLLVFLMLCSSLWAGNISLGTGCMGLHSIAIHSDGSIYAWGYNSHGELGNNSSTDSSVPIAVDMSGVLSGKSIVEIATGLSNTLALASDGCVYTWGRNDLGQSGNNFTDTCFVPTAVYMSGALFDKAIIAVSAGTHHLAVLASDGSLYSWGYNSHGQLGINSTATYRYVPIPVDTSGVLSGKTITAVSTGAYYTLALASDGSIYGWGDNTYGQLGDSSTTWCNVPVAVDMSGFAGKTITAVAAGANHSLALASDGSLYSWGWNRFGQLGDNSTDTSLVPLAVDMSGVLAGKTIIGIHAGYWHSLALASDGSVYAWGSNTYGQLGNNSRDESHVPVAVDMNGALAGKTIISSATGFYKSMVLASDGSIYAWGYNHYGALGNNTTTDSYVPVQVVNADSSDFLLPIKATDLSAGAEEFGLQNAYPNPFNPSVTLSYTQAKSGIMSLKIYDLQGQLIETLVNQFQQAGTFNLNWQPENLSTGIYIIRYQSGSKTNFQKIAFVK